MFRFIPGSSTLYLSELNIWYVTPLSVPSLILSKIQRVFMTRLPYERSNKGMNPRGTVSQKPFADNTTKTVSGCNVEIERERIFDACR
jgi:hypothetical protein